MKNMRIVETQMIDAFEIIETVLSERVKDDCDLFDEQFAIKLREFDEHTCANIIKEMNYIIFLTESNLL
jgi:hypothetical protein